ncbi:MAG: hypothetical protein JO340_18355 [Acidobacteriaceae bacterium]|nr:hypothetical protein [Acidobacteriaceae bacterium]
MFSRQRPKVLSFNERVERLRSAAFATETMSDGRVKISKNGVGALVGDEGRNQPQFERAGILVGSDIAALLNGGYQMFLETPSGRRMPATAAQLKALHEFEEDIRAALGMVDLYNTSLGTTSPKHLYDRVFKRDAGRQPKPWDKKEHRIVPPDTKGSLHL